MMERAAWKPERGPGAKISSLTERPNSNGSHTEFIADVIQHESVYSRYILVVGSARRRYRHLLCTPLSQHVDQHASGV